MLNKQNVTAVILAGGKGRRMHGQDKGLIELANRPLIEYVIDAIKPQVETIILNANRNREHYSSYGYPVISDSSDDFQGPLAGFFSAMTAATTSHIITLPCDGPLLANDLVERLIFTLNDKTVDDKNPEIAVAHDGDRMQPVYALMPTTLKTSLGTYLKSGERKVDFWYRQLHIATTDFSDCPETFRNINTTEQRDTLLRDLLQDEGLLS